jgi:hypothetical protein
MINVADCKTSKTRLLAVKYLILIIYNYPTAKTRTSAKNISFWVTRLCDSGRAPSEASSTPRLVIAQCPASIPHVALHILL